MKKVISMILALSVSLVCLVPFSAFAEAVDISYLYKENFDTIAIGGIPTSATVAAKSNRIYVADYPDSYDRSLRYEVNTTSDSHIDISIGASEGKLVIEFDVLFENIPDSIFAVFFKNSANKEYTLMRFNQKLELLTSTGTAVFSCEPGKFYKIAAVIDCDTGLSSIYVNHINRASSVRVGDGNFGDVSLVRFHALSVGTGEKPSLYLDDLKIYSAEYPVFVYENLGYEVNDTSEITTNASGISPDGDVADYMTDAVAIYVNKNKIYSDGKLSYVDEENLEASPYISNERTLVPLRCVVTGFGAEVEWKEDSSTAVIELGGSKIEFAAGENQVIINGESKPTDVAPEIKDNRMYVPIRYLCEAIGKKLTYYDCGLIVIADRENYFTLRNDLGVFRKLCGNLCFSEPSGEEMVAMISERHSDDKHPILYADEKGIDVLRQRVQSDMILKSWYEDVAAEANSYLAISPVVYEIPDGIRLLSVSRAAKDRILALSFMYQITEDTKYAERALKELNAVCSFKDWNPTHFLDTAEMMSGVAFGYDWLYDYMNEEQRETVKTALLEKGIMQTMEDYTDATRTRTYKWAQSNVGDNWNVVCNSGTLQAAMVLAYDEPEACAEVFDYGMDLLKNAALLFAPDGAWYEGPGYWEYTARYYAELMDCLESTFGDTFGFLDIPGIAETGYYVSGLTGSKNIFNFHDVDEATINSSVLLYFSDKCSDPGLTAMYLDKMTENSSKGCIRDIFWYNPDMNGALSELAKDFYWHDTEVMTMRSGYNDSSVFAGLHAGKVNVYHGHMDVGTFVIDGWGTRYACDLGKENYNIADSEWNLYRYRAEGHNTLVINPGTDGGQLLSGDTVIDRYETSDWCSYGIVDMTSAYKNAGSIKRGLKLTNCKKDIIVQDEIELETPSEVWWFMHTKQPIEVAQDGKSAIIKGEYMDMRVSLISDANGTFSVMDALPMSTSPQNASQNKNVGYQKLAFKADDVTTMTLAMYMEFIPSIPNAASVSKPEVVPLDMWTLDTNQSGEAEPAYGKVSLNGVSLGSCKTDNRTYSYTLEAEEELPEVTCITDGEYEVYMPEELPGRIVVKISESGKQDSYYVIALKRKLLTKVPDGYTKYEPVSVSASSIPQPENSPENTLDGDLSTRWSAQGEASITYDLGASVSISYVGLAIWQGTTNDGRKQYFDIEVSDDGKDYTTVYSGETSGTTLEEELMSVSSAKGRYVRISCSGTSVGDWNSITECSVYGK